MKGLVETIQGPGSLSIRWSMQDIFSHLCKQTLKLILKHVISVNSTTTYLGNHQSILLQWWPFAQWGLDILGLFPIGTRQMKFLVVGIDYFTKWVEAELVGRITEQNVRNFI